MISRDHALVSLVVAAAALALTTPPRPAWVVVAVALVAGVGIDFDHFLLAWWKTGGWEPVRRCLRDPKIVFVAQDEIFAAGEVGAITRLLSHVVIGGVVVPLLWLRWPYLAGVVGASLYAHVLADLYETDRNRVAVGVADLSDATKRTAGVGDPADAGRDSTGGDADG